MSHHPDREAVRMTTSVAARYKARSWSLSAEDIHQEAYLAYYKHLAVADKIWDPARGVPKTGMIVNRMWRHMADHVYDMGSPVAYKHRRSELKNVSSAEHSDETTPGNFTAADEQVGHQEWRLAVQRRIRELAGERGVAIAPVVLGEATVAAIATAHDMKVETVRRMTKQVKTKLKADPVLRSLWGLL